MDHGNLWTIHGIHEPRDVPVLGDEVSIAPSRVQEVIEGIVLNKMHTWDMSVAYQLRL